MTAAYRRAMFIVVLVLALVAGALWFINGSGENGQQPRDDAETSGEVTVMPTDGGGAGPTEVEEVDRETPSATEFEVTGDFTDPEQVAHAFTTTYPGDVEAIADPTFVASLDGVDTSLAAEITDPWIEHVDQSVNGISEMHAFTIHGTYQGSRVPAYSIIVSRPAEPAEGGSIAENTLEFRIDSFDWAPAMLGDENGPGPAAGELAPLSAEQRGNLISQTRTDVITPILTIDPEESTKQRQARLDGLTVERIEVTPPMSRSGRYAMTTEILSQAYSTQPGSPITITYTGTWVDPYDPTYNGSWSLTATITRDDDGAFIVHSVGETAPTKGTEQNG